MLPDFQLPISLAGQPRVLLARDVTVAEFFHGFPNSAPSMPCYDKETPAGQHGVVAALEGWALALLVRAVVKPQLTLEHIHRLGGASASAVLTYLQTVGWIAGDQVGTPARALLPPETILERETWRRLEAAWIASLPPFTTVPVDNIKAALKLVASKCRTAPHVVWTRWHISEFIFDWRILLQDDLLARETESDEGQSMLGSAGIEE